MSVNSKIKSLSDCLQSLLCSENFKDLTVILAAISLERLLKKAVIYNYRCSGLSAQFIRKRLLDKMTYAQLLNEFEWSCTEGINLFKLWNSKKMEVKDLNGIMKVRNKVIHSNGNVSLQEIEVSVKEILYVIENLALIFSNLIGYNGIAPLPKTIPKNQLKLTSKILHKSIVSHFHK